ncbi:unnamed protein product [Linum tenue]|uniref:non-specific serine/threonine protein kinase n=1 Tax=Linum tenue TaxID=586396 RepID=A0AAV0NLL4_9ROSI|nr:unnamed protein product [Linum tenue]
MKQTHHCIPLKLLLLPLLIVVSFDFASVGGGSSSSNNFTDRLALLEFKRAITNGGLESWNDSFHFCNWVGITCSQEQRVTSLSLPGYNLRGALSPHIANFSFLQTVHLTNNSLHGEIPQQFGSLLHLRILNLTSNSIEGEIPVNLTRCAQLRELRLSHNRLTGPIPSEIGLLSNLKVIRIVTNELTGPIPASLGNLSKLNNFGAAYNHLVGPIPETVGRLSRLSEFVVGVNQLNGTIPPSLYNLSSITVLTLIYNEFQGRIPEDIGFTLPNLQSYGVSLNWMSGPIPTSFCNASQLHGLSLNKNSFSGKIPTCFGSLPKLLYFHMAINNLGANSSGDFEFITGLTNCSQLQELGVTSNNLGGPLPDSVGNLSIQLDMLFLTANSITGNIPAGLGNLINLNTIDLSLNLLTGRIPSYFGKFQKLQGMWMEGNQLSGRIPSSLGNLTQLNQLDISDNQLEGAIPQSLGRCRRLGQLDVSANKLTGEIPTNIFRLSSLSVRLNLSWNSFAGRVPEEIGQLVNVEALDLSHNFLTRGIPEAIGDCKSLKALYLQGNSFSGSIPLGFASLRAMESLDLSSNNFTGGIPSGLQDIPTLQNLNLSFNDLRGEVPSKGIFANASGVSLMGNPLLCGNVSELHLPDCPAVAKSSRHKRAATVKLSLVIVLASLAFLFVSGLLICLQIKRSKKRISVGDSALNNFVMVSYKDLHQGTNGFSSENLIGSGGFSTIYKGVLEQIEAPVAVKVLNNIQDRKAHKSLLAECNALRNVRHRNLVRILTYCSSLDHKGNDFKALVFEFMPKGNLEEWLHSSDRDLTLIQRLSIAVDVASGLHYLHDLCETPVVHCDLKPNNVLLDSDMVARVGDFGLARILFSSDTSSSSSRNESSTIGIKGTIGYAPPEYGMGKVVCKEGDVYSFGILLLEMFTGRRPTDEMFKDGVNLCEFVKGAIPSGILSVLDPSMSLPVATRGGEGVTGTWETYFVDGNGIEVEELALMESATNCLVSVLEIALSCASELPRERTKIADVAKQLTSIRDDFAASFHVRRGRPDRG